MPAHDVAVSERRHWPPAHLEQLHPQHLAIVGLSRAQSPVKKTVEPLSCPGREATTELLRDGRRSEPGRQVEALRQALTLLRPGDGQRVAGRTSSSGTYSGRKMGTSRPI